ncbi:regulator of telomere elongation helicase 1-like isoform X2 [Acanthaster planci]|uniref:Regulator of telomere elongation helicase 1 homolog n=1 Tax=Acanthaster planci TaxID=133434 RepID=A0A8B7YGW4_ACAPL|nr:regulator of telomere elongation helicase 1-like isoform X2 [Acanthaster planci]
MPLIKCKGVNIEFPFEPYDCQQDYMSKVVECLQSGKNGILESPTGTGKTLCLLCSALAWRNTYISQQELGRCLQGDSGDWRAGDQGSFRQKLAAELKEGAGTWDEGQQGMFVDRPRIIYASRTHSQLSQAVDQLKDTAYRPRVAVIGSREQLCIHPDVQKAESNSTKVHMCRAKVDSRTCHFYNNLDQKKADKAFTDNILDIEDLVKLGNKHKVCPYYMARELKANADIIFMPYNYLLDSKSRRIHGVELQGNVVIFDEAHNVEKMCEESASFDLTSFDLASCVEETDHLLKKTVEVDMCNQQFRAADSGGEGEFDTSALATLKKLFLDLENEINGMNPPEAGITKPGSFIYELFAKVHITFETKVELLQLLEKMVSHLTTSSTIFHNKAAGLQKFCDIINIVFNRDTPSGTVSEASRCYKVHIRASAPQKKAGRTDLWTSSNAAKAKKQGYTLSYWCFSPGFSMKDLVSQGVRSIILTSGTLSPLNSFKSELQIDFPIQLENPHVISKHQMTVAVMTKGPDGTVLNSSYNTRFNRDYVMSLGNAIVNFSRLVPNGLLVFFPSYPVMNHALEQWQEAGIKQRITQYKEVFVEPKGKVIFIETIESFYEKINDPKLNGACFFAVCRGKVSEGLDFADINGRAVVITGLPFPPRMDPRVVLKMQYLDETKRRNPGSLSGQEWYRQQASRAVNQAIGRVIRHKEDFGAILLCDTRFSNWDARNQLPSWVRPYVNIYDQFGKGVRDLTNFFKETERTMPKPQPKQVRSSVPVRIDQDQCQQQALPTTSLSSAGPVIKAKHVDTHVPSLKRNHDGSHVSEAQLKIMYEDSRPKQAKKGVGLLNALSSVENTPEDDDDGFLSQRINKPTSQEARLSKRLDQQKKKKIIIKQQNGLDSVGNTAGLPPPTASSKQERKDRGANPSMASAQDYIAQTDNFGEMVAGIADLFTEDESKFPLFRNFYTFARPHHKKQFHTICINLTGQGCGYKPEHSIPPKKLEKQKPFTPSTSIDRSKSGPPEQNRLQNGPLSCKGVIISKAANPTKRHKPDSFDLSSAGISNNTTGPDRAACPLELSEEVPRKSLPREDTVSKSSFVPPASESDLSAESLANLNKTASSTCVENNVDSFTAKSKVDPSADSVKGDSKSIPSNTSELEAKKVKTSSCEVQDIGVPSADVSITLTKPPESKPNCVRQQLERSRLKVHQGENSGDCKEREKPSVDDRDTVKNSTGDPFRDVRSSDSKKIRNADSQRQDSKSKPGGSLSEDAPCFSEEPKVEFEDSQEEDAEEPMSLESSTDEDPVLNASDELFDAAFSSSNPLMGKSEEAHENKTETKGFTDKDQRTASLLEDLPGPSIGGATSQVEPAPSAREEPDNSCSRPKADPPVAQGSKRWRIQKMVDEVKRTLSDLGALEGRSNRGSLKIENTRSQREVGGKDSHCQVVQKNCNNFSPRSNIFKPSSKVKSSSSQDDFQSPSQLKSSKRNKSDMSPGKLSRKREADNLLENRHKKICEGDDRRFEKLTSKQPDGKHLKFNPKKAGDTDGDQLGVNFRKGETPLKN